VDWISGGHDGGDSETARVEGRVGSWFDRYLKEETGTDTGPAFRVTRTGGIDSTDGAALKRGASSDTYPGLRSGGREIPLRATGGGGTPAGAGAGAGTGTATKSTGSAETFRNPAGAVPPAISAVPGVGGGLSQLSSLGVGLSLDFPGQFGRFESAPLATSVRVTGTPTVRVNVKEAAGQDAVLFGKVYDVSPDGRQQVLPSQLVAPYRITADQQGKPIELALPAVDHEFDAGHRMRLVFSATDLGYASPAEPATYTVTADGPLTVPTAPAVTTAAATLPWWTWGLPAAALVIAAGL
ncbi:ABC transporter ATP-binding protein, partial [Streptomyces sp. SID8455]|nr:ABC transporter ATP-binding protein [Streptomyces sp. SID8455]